MFVGGRVDGIFFFMHISTVNMFMFAGDFKDRMKGKWEVAVPEPEGGYPE
jgi:hypothetical protein